MEISDKLIYEKKVLIRSEQVDMSRHLRMSELFRLLEEASIAHTEELGCTKDKTLDRGLLWIITRQLVEIDTMPAYDDEITVRSWQGDMQHVFFPRFYEIEREGRVIIRGQALWMLIEETTRSMVMPEDYDIFIPGRPGAGDMMLPAIVIPENAKAAKITIGKDSDTAKNADTLVPQIEGTVKKASAAKDADGTKYPAASNPAITASHEADTPSSRVISIPMKTRFSQVDINGHMNNTRYFDMIDDALHAQTDNGCIASSFINGTDPATSPVTATPGSDAAYDAATPGSDAAYDAATPGSDAATPGSDADSPSKNEYLSAAVREHRIPKTVLANYLNELRLGDEFTLYIYAEGCPADPSAKTASTNNQTATASDQTASTIDSADATLKATSRTLYFEGRAGKTYFRIRYEY